MRHFVAWLLGWLTIFVLIGIFVVIGKLLGATICILSIIVTGMIGSYFITKDT